mgnify:CR=1 FL=1
MIVIIEQIKGIATRNNHKDESRQFHVMIKQRK